jgi:hypothetical protein
VTLARRRAYDQTAAVLRSQRRSSPFLESNLIVLACLLSGAILLMLVGRLADLRGRETDLFPRWYALRQLLHGRNPYGDDVSREIAAQIWFFQGQVSSPEVGPATPLETIYGFLYPMPGALFLLPLAWLPYHLALGVWLWLVLLLLPAAAWLIVQTELQDARGPVRRLAPLLSAPLALLFLPAWANLMLAQPAAAVTFLVAAAVWAAHRIRPAAGDDPARCSRPGTPDASDPAPNCRLAFVAGACLAAAGAIKPHLLALLAPCWLGYHAAGWLCGDARSRRFVLGAVAGAALLAALATALVPSWLWDFGRAAREYAAVAPGWPATTVLARTLLPAPWSELAAALASATAAGWTAHGWWRARRDRRLERAAVYRTLVATCLIIPPAWETNAVLLLLPLAALLGRAPSLPSAAGLIAASAALSFAQLPFYLAMRWERGTFVIAGYLALLAASSRLLPPRTGPAATRVALAQGSHRRRDE